MVTQTGPNVVEFSFIRPKATAAAVVGDFNGWSRTAMPMRRAADGTWTCTLVLSPGVYQFRYYSDGEWYMDHAAFGVEFGPYGPNSVVNVGCMRAAVAIAPTSREERQTATVSRRREMQRDARRPRRAGPSEAAVA